MTNTKLFLCLVLILFISTISHAQTISPYLVGSNYWYQIDTKPKVIELLGQSSLKSVRIGGNGYNGAMPSNATLTSWVNQLKGMGIEPILQVAVKSNLTTAEKAAAAAAVVKYFNVDTNNPIKYWTIGNEPNLNNLFTVAQVYDYTKELAKAMKTVDPTIIIYATELAWIDFNYLTPLLGAGTDQSLDLTGLKLDGTETYLIDGFSWHRYPLASALYTREKAQTVFDTDVRTNAIKVIDMMSAADVKHGRTGDKKLKWGIGEFNINVAVNYGSNPLFTEVEGIGTNSFLNGQFFAEVFDFSMEYEASFATSWSIHESGGSRGPGDLSLLNGDGDNVNPRSSYYHSKMVAENIYGEYLKVIDNKSLVKSFGSVHPDQSISIMVLNKELSSGYNFSLHLNKDAAADTNDLQLNAQLAIDKTLVGYIPPQATMVFNFSAAGDLTSKILYTLAHAKDLSAPTVLGPLDELPLKSVILKDKSSVCVNTSVTYSYYTTAAADQINWNFGADATPATYSGVGPISVSYANAGAKNITLDVIKGGVTTSSDYNNIVTISSCVQGPYLGVKQQIPGTIETVYYDEGGNNVAYYDTTPDVNRGAGIRSNEGVDTDLGDLANGKGNIGYLEQGEWIEYTIDVKESGTYNMDIRYATQTGTGSFKILIGGIDKTGVIKPAATSSWSDYKVFTKSGISIDAGESVIMRIEVVTSGGVNLSTINFTKAQITAIEELGSHSFSLYPNPASNRLFMNTTFNKSVKYDITGLVGNLFSNGTLAQGSNEIPINELGKGLYIIRFNTDHGQLTQLFLKE